MQKSASLELLADAAGAVTFGWAGERVFYARFSRSLSARLGQTFAARIADALNSVSTLTFFADARDLASYDLLARGAVLRVLKEQHAKLEGVEVLWWSNGGSSGTARAALGDALRMTPDAAEFEARLVARAPHARSKLLSKPDSPHRSRWPLRR
jgi:hypothetical protein